MKGQYGRPAKRDRQRKRQRTREGQSPPPLPKASPTPRASWRCPSHLSQGAHSAKLGHSLKPSDASHQPAPDTHTGTHSGLYVAAHVNLVCHAPGSPSQDQVGTHTVGAKLRATDKKWKDASEGGRSYTRRSQTGDPGGQLLQGAQTEGQTKIPPPHASKAFRGQT